jgi:hypothetical protein
MYCYPVAQGAKMGLVLAKTFNNLADASAFPQQDSSFDKKRDDSIIKRLVASTINICNCHMTIVLSEACTIDVL